MDFETYSTGGYFWDPSAGKFGKWRNIADKKGGIGVIGAAKYAEHPSTEIISLAYDLKDGLGERLWVPGCPSPEDLFDHIGRGGLIEAWNSFFEYLIWDRVAHRRMGWPRLPIELLRCAQSKAMAAAWPRALGKAAEAMGLDIQKDTEGKRLIRKFSIPRTPSQKDPRQRIWVEEEPTDGPLFLKYNIQDIKAEAAASAVAPDLSPQELEIWLMDQRINERGVYIDPEGLADCLDIMRQATAKYTAELIAITGGAVKTVNEVATFKKWLNGQGVPIPNMQKGTVDEWAKREDVTGDPHRALEIRALLGSAAVKKLFAIEHQLCADGRLRGLYAYCGAHTTRWAGQGPQPQNLTQSHKNTPGHPDKVQHVLDVIASRDLPRVEALLGNPIAAVSGCLRGLFSGAPGKELISSDYSAIEAVVNAVLAGEQWRIEVFVRCKADPRAPDIYEMSASKTAGVPAEEIAAVRVDHGGQHPLRKGLGKIRELALGYQGWIGAMKNFGADKYFNDDREIRDAILAWRDDSPMIVEAWGGQIRQTGRREFRRELYGVEGMAISAILNPGVCYAYRSLTFGVKEDVMYCRVPSGEVLTYHHPRLHVVTDRFSGLSKYGISYMGWNSNPKKGPTGWMRLEIYGGLLWENIVQKVARDYFAHAMPKLEAAGYPVVMHTHDEPTSEVDIGYGSIEEYERIMCDSPVWAAGWPINASGGWRGRRFRKD